MDHKAWLWRKKSTEKIIVATDKVDLPSNSKEEEIQTVLADKAELENDLKILNEKLSSALSECNANDEFVTKHRKMTEEAMAGCKKAEAKTAALEKELDEALQQIAAGEERSTHLDAALKECMQQLRFVREDQEQRIHDAMTKTSNEFEKSQLILEEKLAEAGKRLAKIVVENTHLRKALLEKEKLIEDLSKQKAQAEADFNALMSRLESTEKDNASLKYEVQVLEKELEIRNEEREFNRRTADASHKQHLESVKRIAKLESECHRLRILVRKRLPGPAALAKMKSEVEILGRDSVDTRRRRSPSPNGLVVDSTVDSHPETPSKSVNFLTEQLCAMEEENKTLKEALNKKANELQFSRSMYARTASKLSQVESHLDELAKGQTTLEPSRRVVVPQELSLASMSDISSDDKVSSAESWASALISELEHFKHGKQRGSPSNRTVGGSDMSLMDDFAEIERLAIVSVDKQYGSPRVSPDNAYAIIRSMETHLNGFSSEVTGREIIPVSESGSRVSNHRTKLIDKAPGWIQDILKVVLEHNRVTQRKPDEILEDVRVALANINHAIPAENGDPKESSMRADGSNSPHIGGYISWKPKHLVMDSSGTATDVDAVLTDKSNQPVHSELGKSLCKLIELIEGITLSYPEYGTSERNDGNFLPYKKTETHSGYMVRVFQWKSSELNAVLQQFVHACYDLLYGKSDVKGFSQELCSALDWTMNHCFSIQDVSSISDAVKKHFDWDEARSDGETEAGQVPEVHKLNLSREELLCLPLLAASNGHANHFEKEEFRQSTARDENKKLKDDLISIESAKMDLEKRLQLATDMGESLTNKLMESEKTIESLQTELETLRGSRAIIENQIENHKLMKEDLDTQLTIAKVELNEAQKNSSSLEVELENKNSYCEELEATCLELQLQLQSVTKTEITKSELHQQESQLRTDWEITAASEKLAECQETILNLGKQLKALASPREAALFDKVISTPTDTNTTSVTTATSTAMTSPKRQLLNQRSSLLDQMLAEDNAEEKYSKPPKLKKNDNDSSLTITSNGVIEPLEKILILNGISRCNDDVTNNVLAIVPSKKKGGSLWRKLLWRKKKSNIKKPSFPYAP